MLCSSCPRSSTLSLLVHLPHPLSVLLVTIWFLLFLGCGSFLGGCVWWGVVGLVGGGGGGGGESRVVHPELCMHPCINVICIISSKDPEVETLFYQFIDR